MRSLFKGRLLNSYSASLSFNTSHFSTISKLSKIHEKPNSQNQQEPQNFRPLFNEILTIVGTEDTISDESSFGFSLSKQTQLKNADEKLPPMRSSQVVCENADEKMEKEIEELSSLEDSQMGNVVEIDVSPIVHKITEIVRGENGVLSMEETLDKASFEYNVEVIDKVLKRCFKVPHLALRFFNWVSLKNGFNHTTKTYNTMIYIASEAKQFKLVEKLVREMEKNCCNKDEKTWTILMDHYGKAKLIGKALFTFEKMKECGINPDIVTYKLMLKSLCKSGKAEIALEYYKEMIHKEMEIDLTLYKHLLKCLAQSGDITSVYSIGNDMIRLSLVNVADMYSFVLKSFCISGRINEALQLIRDLKNKNISISPEHLETLVKGFCRANKITDALEIVDILKKRNTIDSKIYGIVIDGYLRRNDIDKALDLFENMKVLNYSPTLSTYTSIMQHLFRNNEFIKGLELYNEMINTGIELDSVVMTCIVTGYIQQNLVTEGLNVFKCMKEKGIKATRKSYSVLFKELCKVSATNEIFEVLNEMRACKVTIGDDVFQFITSYLEKKGDIENLEKLKQIQRGCELYIQKHEESTSEINDQMIFEETKQENCTLESKSRTYNEHEMNEICRILSFSTNWDLVQEKLEKFNINYTPELVISVLRNSTLHNYAALRFFSWVGKKNGYKHTTESYNMAIKISGQGKDFKNMRNLFFEMKRRGFLVTSDTWTIIIMQYGKTGLTNLALDYFKEMKSNGFKPSKSTYKTLIISLCGKKGRKVDESIEIFNEMIRESCVPDKELIEIYLTCLSEENKLEDAKKCIESLRKIGFSIPLSYSFYIRSLCRAGKLEEALNVLNEVEREEQHIVVQYTYGSLIHAYLRRGEIENALEKIDSMKKIGVNPTIHVYTSLIVHFFKENKIEKALDMFQEMKKMGCEPNIVTYSAMIRGYLSTGKIDEAWNVYYNLKKNGPFPDFKTYSMFITCLCKIGKSEDALRLISEMKESGIVPSTVNFRNVFFGLNREGKSKLAQTVLHKKWELKYARKSFA